MDERAFREINEKIISFYDLNISDILKVSKKSYLVKAENQTPYFFKKTGFNTLEKYLYLADLGINNILYPKLNNQNQYVSKIGMEYFYIADYIEKVPSVNEMKVLNLYKELRSLHSSTSFKRQLSPAFSRAKFEEITRQLDHKFIVIEEFVKSVESKDLTVFSMPILANYRYILDAKKELIRLQKLIIGAVKDRLSVEYSFIHNNPKLEHLLSYRGSRYLTSIENSKMGISSLDMAKLYIETEDLNIDFKSFIVDYYYQYNETFYYDYFRFLVLFIYIKRLVLNDLDYVSAQNFINVAESIKKYFTNFLDKQEQISEEDESYN